MSTVNNSITDLIDEMERLSSKKLHIPCDDGVPFYSELDQKAMVQMSRAGKLEKEEVFEDMKALGFLVEPGFTMDFLHYSGKGEGPVWKMGVSNKFIGETIYINFDYYGRL